MGGQQAVIGHGNNLYQDNRTTNIYLELQNADLEPLNLWGKCLSYFNVFVFLLIVLIFWIFFGIFTSFPFPYGQAIDLMLCCFKGTVASKVNILQSTLQNKLQSNIESQSVQKLNNFDFQARLYLGVLKHLGANKAESHERLAKTIEALKQKKSELQNEIKPRQPEKYRIVNIIQDFFEFITLSKAERDLIQIESILNEVTWAIKNDYPSETIIENTIDRLAQETTRKADKVNPFRLGIIYKIENLLNEVSNKAIFNLEESELNEVNRKIISELKEQKNNLSRELSKLRDDNHLAQQELRNYSEQLDSLNYVINERESDLLNLREKLRAYAEGNQSNQNQINTLKLELSRTHQELTELQVEKSSLSERLNLLNQDVRHKQDEIHRLTKRLNQYSEIRMLKGEYIGNLSDRNGKYHFDRNCNHWKMLVGEYVLNLDGSREIVSTNNPSIFTGKLTECKRCTQRKN